MNLFRWSGLVQLSSPLASPAGSTQPSPSQAEPHPGQARPHLARVSSSLSPPPLFVWPHTTFLAVWPGSSNAQPIIETFQLIINHSNLGRTSKLTRRPSPLERATLTPRLGQARRCSRLGALRRTPGPPAGQLGWPVVVTPRIPAIAPDRSHRTECKEWRVAFSPNPSSEFLL